MRLRGGREGRIARNSRLSTVSYTTMKTWRIHSHSSCLSSMFRLLRTGFPFKPVLPSPFFSQTTEISELLVINVAYQAISLHTEKDEMMTVLNDLNVTMNALKDILIDEETADSN